ncbi:unnamed protein product [Microthlaspi erraticum]|uniref:Uncharacterized protein n=1 Tax=Microthlaspi erraticum TaxID=1685480 RepID=A0A6D2HG88_9BRAS|nr:unnamed protein product [Microthlaspi erraticum]
MEHFLSWHRPQVQAFIDTASNGNFMTKTIDEAKGQLKHINAIEGMTDANEDPSRECMGDFSNEANEEDVNYIGNYGNKEYNPNYGLQGLILTG